MEKKIAFWLDVFERRAKGEMVIVIEARQTGRQAAWKIFKEQLINRTQTAN